MNNFTKYTGAFLLLMLSLAGCEQPVYLSESPKPAAPKYATEVPPTTRVFAPIVDGRYPASTNYEVTEHTKMRGPERYMPSADIAVFTDDNGCQYLIYMGYNGRAMVQRMGKDHEQICG